MYLHDRATRTTTLVSRAGGRDGAAADGYSAEPAVSADGTRVAFTSTAASLSDAKPGGLTGVFLRDIPSGTTLLLSTHEPVRPKARAASATAHRAPGLLCRIAA